MLFNSEKVLEQIDKEISSYNFGCDPIRLYEPIRYILALGGKRLRPLLTLMSHRLFSEDLSSGLRPALSVEVFHNFTLMHDDIMDNAPLRRGKPSVHEKWNKNVAILSGDVMLVKAYELLLNVEERKLKRVIAAFNECASGVCEGQQLDVDFEQAEQVTEEQYLEMIKLKTAILLGFCAELGGITGGASEENIQRLKEFGINIGLAFQLKDDLLDVFGDAAKFGKMVGGDIVANKKTFLLIQALQLANGKEKENLQRLLKDKNIDKKAKVDQVTAIYTKLNIPAIIEEKIQYYYTEAMKCLNKVESDLYKKRLIKDFVGKLMVREN